MTPDLFDIIIHGLKSYGIFGGFGGVVSFLHALRRDQIKSQEYFKNSIVDIAGGTIVATVASEPVFLLVATSSATQMLVPFAIGLAWSQIIQGIRTWITAIVGKALDASRRKKSNERKRIQNEKLSV